MKKAVLFLTFFLFLCCSKTIDKQIDFNIKKQIIVDHMDYNLLLEESYFRIDSIVEFPKHIHLENELNILRSVYLNTKTETNAIHQHERLNIINENIKKLEHKYKSTNKGDYYYKCYFQLVAKDDSSFTDKGMYIIDSFNNIIKDI